MTLAARALHPRTVLGRFRLLDPRLQDGLLAVLLFGIGIVGLYGPVLFDQPYRDPDAGAWILIGLQTFPLIWRRVHPVAVLATAGPAGAVYLVASYLPTNALMGVLVALYSVAAHAERRVALRAAAVTAAFIAFVYGGGMAVGRQELTLDVVAMNVAIFALAWLLGDAMRSRRDHAIAMEERAARLEAEREDQARLAVAAERARIARELHDVIAHHVTVMVVQAGAARRLAPSEPDTAMQALGDIEGVGREALVEMRRLLGVLRGEADDRPATTEPQPTLAGVGRLCAEVQRTGVDVELQVEGDARSLPPAVDLSAYRVVQEALTNVVKHAGQATVHVHVRYGTDELEVAVTDDGRGAAAVAVDGVGHGLIGMRERVALFGGELRASPRRGGGFDVRARFPLAQRIGG